MSTEAAYRPTPLKWAVGLSVLNGLVGAVLGPVALAHGYLGAAFSAIAFSVAALSGAWGLFHLQPWGYWLLLVLSAIGAFGLVLDLIFDFRIGVDTSLVVFLILIFAKSVREAVEGSPGLDASGGLE